MNPSNSSLSPAVISPILLNENSKMWEDPISQRIVLKDHQKTLIQRCVEFQHNDIPVSEGEHMKTSIGILGDKVGSGKSYVILSLVKITLPFEKNRPQYKTHANNHLHLIKKLPREYIQTSVIVIPHNLCKQWESYVANFDPDMKVMVINKHKKIVSDCDLSTYDLIIVTCSMYNHFALQFDDVTFALIFFDEADSINIPSCKPMLAMFYWFVTASFDNLAHPYGQYVYNEKINRYVELAKGLKNTGFIKEMFASIHQTKQLCRLILVKNEDDFVNRSLALPSITNTVVECKTPFAVSILSNIVDKEVIRCLNANDVKRAIQCIHPSNRGTEENIIALCVDKLNKNLKNILLRIDLVEKMEYDVERDRDEEVEKLNKLREELETKIAAITDRVKERDQCPICFDEIREKTVLNCCNNAFCFKCISVWLLSSKFCPFCKAGAQVQNLLVVDVQSEAEIKREWERKRQIALTIHPENDKVVNLINILKTKTDKTLVFSQYDDGIRSIATALNQANISFSYLKGACSSVTSILEKFKSGAIKVLLVNPIHYGSGLNMECTTDIVMFHKFDNEMEKQVIGRAHRCGRTEPLSVWYLLHHNEL